MTIRKKIATSGAIIALGCGLLGGVATMPAAYAEEPSAAAAPISHTYPDGATIEFPATWVEGQPIEFTGTNLFATDGSPSVLAVRLNGGTVGSSDYLQFTADADGKVTGSIPWQDRFTVGGTADINVLSGSLNPKDNRRGGIAATVTIVAADGGAKNDNEAKNDAAMSTDQAMSTPAADPSAKAGEGEGEKKEQESATSVESTASEEKKPEENAASAAAPSSSSASAEAAKQTSNTSSNDYLPWVGYGLIGLGVLVAAVVIIRNLRKSA